MQVVHDRFDLRFVVYMSRFYSAFDFVDLTVWCARRWCVLALKIRRCGCCCCRLSLSFSKQEPSTNLRPRPYRLWLLITLCFLCVWIPHCLRCFSHERANIHLRITTAGCGCRDG